MGSNSQRIGRARAGPQKAVNGKEITWTGSLCYKNRGQLRKLNDSQDSWGKKRCSLLGKSSGTDMKK